MKEKKIKISVNEEDVQNLINCYEKDIEYIKKLEKENEELKERINKAIEILSQKGDIPEEEVIKILCNVIKKVRELLKGEE